MLIFVITLNYELLTDYPAGAVLIEYNGSEFEDSKKRLQILWDNKTRNLFTKERFINPGGRVERVAMSDSDGGSVGNTVSMSTLTKPEV